MSTFIHPTAVIDSSTDLGNEVRVGPFAIIEAGCVIGDYSEIRAHAVICKGSLMGPNNQIGYGAVIGAEPQDYGYKGGPSRVEIGKGNKIREYVTIHRASQENGATSIGNDNFIMGGVHLGHDTQIGDGAILANNTLLSGYVEVGDRAFLGGATIVHQHVRIEALRSHAGDATGQDVPPFFMAVDTNQVSGVNRIGLRRAGFSQDTRRAIQAAYEMIYSSNLNVTQALAELRAKFHFPEITQLIEFIGESKRGFVAITDGVQSTRRTNSFEDKAMLTPDLETKGLKAYEQARAFERLRTWRLPLTYCVFILLPAVMGVAALAMGHFGIGAAQFGAAVLIAIGVWIQWIRLERRYTKNLALVSELEKTTGDQLPWVKMNQHFAELEKLREELEKEKAEGISQGE